MKIKNIWYTVFLMVFVLSGCNERFEEINTNPNAVSDIDDEYLFANAVLQTLRGGNNSSLQFPFGDQYAHIYVGQNNARFVDLYYDYFTSAEYKSLFEAFYYGPIRHIQEVIRFTQPGGEKENEVRHAMAQVISMINFSKLADSFGNIPYLEGGYGQEGIMYPEYDDLEFIYTDMMEKLNNIVALLKTANPEDAYPGADPLYDNELDKWVRFANSFRLRLAMRARFVAPELVNSIIVECLSEPLIEENNQNAWNENFDSDAYEFQNPIFNQYGFWKWKMSEKFVEALKNTSDPRLTVFVKQNNDGEYIGIPNGLSDMEFPNWDWTNVSDPSENLVGKAAPIYEMTAAEIWLLRAEAALFSLIPGDANQLYRTGIQKSFEQWDVPQAEIDSYLLNAGNANLSGSQEQQFEQICTHLWIAYMPNAAEGWNNIRRTGYPVIPTRTEPEYTLGVTEGVLPTRLRYPSSEVNINNENYLKAIEQQGPDLITTPLWWDVKN